MLIYYKEILLTFCSEKSRDLVVILHDFSSSNKTFTIKDIIKLLKRSLYIIFIKELSIKLD